MPRPRCVSCSGGWPGFGTPTPGRYNPLNELGTVVSRTSQPLAKSSALLAASGGLVAAIALPASAAQGDASTTSGQGTDARAVSAPVAVTAPKTAPAEVTAEVKAFGAQDVVAVAKPVGLRPWQIEARREREPGEALRGLGPLLGDDEHAGGVDVGVGEVVELLALGVDVDLVGDDVEAPCGQGGEHRVPWRRDELDLDPETLADGLHHLDVEAGEVVTLLDGEEGVHPFGPDAQGVGHLARRGVGALGRCCGRRRWGEECRAEREGQGQEEVREAPGEGDHQGVRICPRSQPAKGGREHDGLADPV